MDLFKKTSNNTSSEITTPTFDNPSVFGDELAKKTGWDPVNKGLGSETKTRSFVVLDQFRAEFRTSWIVFLMCGIYCIMSFFAIFASGFPRLAENILNVEPGTLGPMLENYSIYVVVFGILSTIYCIYYILWVSQKPFVFDKKSGFFWKGRPKSENPFNEKGLVFYGKLNHVYALQIISEHVVQKGNNGIERYNSYELNIVLENGERINLIDYSKLHSVREDAEKLAVFLNTPLWDATKY